MRLGYSLLALALVSTPAAAGEHVLQLQAGEHQQARVSSGVEYVDSVAAVSVVRFIEPNGTFKKRGELQVYFANLGDAPFNVGPENVTAKLDDGTTVPIIGYEQLAREEKRRQGWARFGAALAAAGNASSAANAGQTYGTATYSGNTYGSFGGYGYQSQTTGFATYQGNDPRAAAIAGQTAQRQNEAIMARLAERARQGDAELAQSFRTTTIDPSGSNGGQVTFELPTKVRRAKGPLNITFFVGAGADQHVIKATVQRSK